MSFIHFDASYPGFHNKFRIYLKSEKGDILKSRDYLFNEAILLIIYKTKNNDYKVIYIEDTDTRKEYKSSLEKKMKRMFSKFGKKGDGKKGDFICFTSLEI